jgi:hypothetical protein
MVVINDVVAATSSPWQAGYMAQYVVCGSVHSTIYCTTVVWLAVFLFKRKEIA